MALDEALSCSTLSDFSSKSLNDTVWQLLAWIIHPDQLQMSKSDTHALPAYTDGDPTLELLARAVIAAKYPSLQTFQNLILQGMANGEEYLNFVSRLLLSVFERQGNQTTVNLSVDGYTKRRNEDRRNDENFSMLLMMSTAIMREKIMREIKGLDTASQTQDRVLIPAATSDKNRSATSNQAKDALSSVDPIVRSQLIKQFWDKHNKEYPSRKYLQVQYYIPLCDNTEIKQLHQGEIELVLRYRQQRSSNKKEYHSVFTRHSLFGVNRWLLGASSRTEKLAAADWLLNPRKNHRMFRLNPTLQKALTTGELGKIYESCRSAGLC